jgi:DNA-binding transcriptional MerR regulator
MDRLITISELAKLLNLLDPKNKKPLNHIIRYWEKEFKQIKPKIINKRRYYSAKDVELLKMIKFHLKTQGMTINGVKSLLNSNINKLDDYNSHGLKAEYYLNNFKKKSRQILDKIKKIKNYGKKNSLKS